MNTENNQNIDFILKMIEEDQAQASILKKVLNENHLLTTDIEEQYANYNANNRGLSSNHMFKNIKAVFFDIDGTLVSFNTHEVPQSAKEAIHEARQHGIKVFIATGRPLPFINNLEGVEYDGIMSVTGACCMTADGVIIQSQPVDRRDIERIIAETETNPMPILFAGRDKAIGCLIDSNREIVEEVMTLLGLGMPEQQPIKTALDMEVMQVIAFFTAEDEPRMMAEVLKGCDAARWHPAFADCIHKGTSKATGIDAICHYYGIELKDTMAVGDGGNDIAMLRHAGIGVAMGNASDEVKSNADYITDCVDEDGVAKLLRKLYPTK